MKLLIKGLSFAIAVSAMPQIAIAERMKPADADTVRGFTWETSGQCTAKCDGDKTRPEQKDVVVSGEGGTTI